jgi:hypothetical protein
MIHYTWFAGSSVMGYCDDWGEKLAWFFGITSPKYYYELVSFKWGLQIKLVLECKIMLHCLGSGFITADQVFFSIITLFGSYKP